MNVLSRPLKTRSKKQIAGWLFISPFLIGFLIYFLKILITSLVFSFSKVELTSQGMASTFNGFSNYLYSLTVDPNFNSHLFTLILQLFSNTPVIIMLSLFIAVMLNKDKKGKAAFRAIFFLPVIVATGLIAKIDNGGQIMMDLGGINTGIATGSGLLSYTDIEESLRSLNLDATFIEYLLAAMENIISIVNQSGIQILLFLTGLQSISPSIYESAKIEGATAWESFWKITFPMITPIIFVNLFYTVIDYFTNSTNVMMEYINTISFKQGNGGRGAARSWLYCLAIGLILLIGILAYALWGFFKKHQEA